MKIIRNFFKYHFGFAAFVTGIFVLSSIPGEKFPEVSFEFGDKVVHVFLYFLLMIFTYISFSGRKKPVPEYKALIYPFLFSVMYGISDEIHQYFVPNRTCDIYDVIADIAGAAAGMLLFAVINKRKIKLSLLDKLND